MSLLEGKVKSPDQQQNAADCHQQNAGHARKKQGLYFKNAAFIFAISKIQDKIHEDKHIFIYTIRKGDRHQQNAGRHKATTRCKRGDLTSKNNI